MELIVTATLFTVILFLTAVHFFTHNSRAGKLINKIPGPRNFPLIGSSYDLMVPLETLWNILRQNGKEYYSIYKFWVGHWAVINIRHPDDVEILLTSQKNIEKSLFYNFLHPWLNTGLLTSTGIKWRTRRKTLTPAFHFNVLQEFVDIFVETSEQMVNSLKKEDGEVIKDVVPIVTKHMLNAICETSMGSYLKETDPALKEYREGLQHMGDAVYYRTVRPWLSNDWIFSLTTQGRVYTKSLNALHYFTNKIIKERKEYLEESGGNYFKQISSEKETKSVTSSPTKDNTNVKKKKLAMLDLLIAVQKEHKNIDDLGIREEVDTFVFEGHDTTSMAMCFTILLLAEHKDIQARARAEVNDIFQQCNGKLGMNELQNLTYLDRCIKESMRLFPPVPLVSRCISEDLQLKNYLIPRGSNINLHIFDVHRDPNFWPQPLVYDPDRFLPEKIKNRHPFSYVPFSGGPRNCIGKKYATLELRTMVAYLLHNFYLEPIIDWRKVRILPDLVLKSVDPLNVKFIPIS